MSDEGTVVTRAAEDATATAVAAETARLARGMVSPPDDFGRHPVLDPGTRAGMTFMAARCRARSADGLAFRPFSCKRGRRMVQSGWIWLIG